MYVSPEAVPYGSVRRWIRRECDDAWRRIGPYRATPRRIRCEKNLRLKLHWFDLLSICCGFVLQLVVNNTTTNGPQQIEPMGFEHKRWFVRDASWLK